MQRFDCRYARHQQYDQPLMISEYKPRGEEDYRLYVFPLMRPWGQPGISGKAAATTSCWPIPRQTPSLSRWHS